MKIIESIQEIFNNSDVIKTSDSTLRPFHLPEIYYATTKTQFTWPPIFSPIKTLDADCTPDSVITEQGDERIARNNVMGKDSLKTNSSLLQSSNSNNERSS